MRRLPARALLPHTRIRHGAVPVVAKLYSETKNTCPLRESRVFVNPGWAMAPPGVCQPWLSDDAAMRTLELSRARRASHITSRTLPGSSTSGTLSDARVAGASLPAAESPAPRIEIHTRAVAMAPRTIKTARAAA